MILLKVEKLYTKLLPKNGPNPTRGQGITTETFIPFHLTLQHGSHHPSVAVRVTCWTAVTHYDSLRRLFNFIVVLLWTLHRLAAACLSSSSLLCFFLSVWPAAISPLPSFSHSHAKVNGRVYLIMNRWVSARFLWHPTTIPFHLVLQLPLPVATRPFPPTLTSPSASDDTLMIFLLEEFSVLFFACSLFLGSLLSLWILNPLSLPNPAQPFPPIKPLYVCPMVSNKHVWIWKNCSSLLPVSCHMIHTPLFFCTENYPLPEKPQEPFWALFMHFNKIKKTMWIFKKCTVFKCQFQPAFCRFLSSLFILTSVCNFIVLSSIKQKISTQQSK